MSIRVEGLVKRYGGRKVVDGVSLHVERVKSSGSSGRTAQEDDRT